jgi:hypothetical protein
MDGVGYDENAAHRSWRHMRLFFAELFNESVTFHSPPSQGGDGGG